MKAEIIGKPAATFFLAALEGIDVSPEDVSFLFNKFIQGLGETKGLRRNPSGSRAILT